MKSLNFKLKGATELNSQLMEQLESSNIRKYQEKSEKLKTENEVKNYQNLIFRSFYK